MKKFFSLVLALVMALSLTTVAWGATYEVDTTEALQAALDSATDGDTIYLKAGVNYGVVYMGRPTKDNATVMACDTHSFTTTDEVAFNAHLGDGQWHTTPKYTTTLKNLTIVGAEGATVAGLVATSGHAYGTGVYDYVRETTINGSAYYNTLMLSNVTFSKVNFTGKIDINTSDATSVYDGVTFDGCTFTTGGTASGNGAAIRYYNEANNGNVKNLTVKNCSFENCFQGVYTHHVNGITVTDCTFDTLGHNAVAVQSHAGSCDHGDVVITENEFENVNDRVIRFNEVGAGSNIDINNNVMLNSGKSNGEMIAATSVATGVEVDLESNYWDGETAATAVASFEEPAVVGITGGTWDSDMNAYAAPGSALVQDTNGNWIAGTAVTMGDKFDLYLADKDMNTALTLKTPSVAGLTFDEVGAKTNTDGSGRVAYIAANNGQYFVKTTSPVISSYAVTYAGKTDVLYYVNVAGTSAANFAYDEEVTAFADWGKKCGQVDITPNTAKTYFKAADGKIYMAGAAGTSDNYLLNGVVVSGTYVGTPIDHAFSAYDYKYDSTLKINVPTAAICTKCLETTTSIYKDTKVPATYTPYAIKDVTGYVVALAPNSSLGGVYVPVTPSPSTDKVQSADTFDAGIAMYVGMSVMAAAGSAVVLKKRED